MIWLEEKKGKPNQNTLSKLLLSHPILCFRTGNLKPTNRSKKPDSNEEFVLSHTGTQNSARQKLKGEYF